MLNYAHLAAAGKRKKPGQDAARFKTDEETGKMVIDEESEGEGGAEAEAAGEDVDLMDEENDEDDVPAITVYVLLSSGYRVLTVSASTSRRL